VSVRTKILAFAAATFLRLLRRSVRLRFHGDETVRQWEREERRFLLAFWHRHLLLMRYAYRGSRMTVLISRSRDGELISQVMKQFGVWSGRGSSSRGGVGGLREMLRAARSGSDLGITPDGPRGPLRKVQPGVVAVAAATGLPLVPVAQAATRRILLDSWDRHPLALPGSRVEFVFGDPLTVPRGGDVEEWSHRIEEALNAVERRAEGLAGHVVE